MSQFKESTNCCGIMELVGMNEDNWSPKNMLKAALEEYWFDTHDVAEAMKMFCHIIFSVAYDPSNKTNKRRASGFLDAKFPAMYKNRATKFAKFIEDNKLGTCVLAKGHKNKINHVVAGLWTVSRSGLAAWIRKENIKIDIRDNNWW